MSVQERRMTTVRPAGLPAVSVGDTVHYRTFLGRVRVCRVTAVYSDVKNGEPGFDAVCPDGNEVWGYCYQVVRVDRGGAS